MRQACLPFHIKKFEGLRGLCGRQFFALGRFHADNIKLSVISFCLPMGPFGLEKLSSVMIILSEIENGSRKAAKVLRVVCFLLAASNNQQPGFRPTF